MVRNVLVGMGKSSSALADITEDTKLTKEEFGELIAKIDMGLRSLPATAQVCLSLLLPSSHSRLPPSLSLSAPLSPASLHLSLTSLIVARGACSLQTTLGTGLGATERLKGSRRRKRLAAL